MVPLLWKSLSAAHYAAQRGLVGMPFDRFGRAMGLRLLLRGKPGAIEYLLTPVSSVRYFEYAFVRECLLGQPKRCLDVSSPRLFSLYAAVQRLVQTIDMINPDPIDIQRTDQMVQELGLRGIYTQPTDLLGVLEHSPPYDCIWSISVVEHIHGLYDDQDAIRMMFAALRPGGRLIVTVPIDRAHWDEYRDAPAYQDSPVQGSEGRHFFQRFYDQASLRERLIAPLGVEPVRVAWYGERQPGRFKEYTQRWLRDGMRCTVEDPREMVDGYASYPSWELMPGMGVCGLCFEKLDTGTITDRRGL
jgi:SAM-dependent methyltransferase